MQKIRIGVVGPGLIWKRAHKPALDLLSERGGCHRFFCIQ